MRNNIIKMRTMATPIEIRESPHVALIIETSKTYGRELLRGISRYARLHGPWTIFATERGQDDPDPIWLRNWKGHGIITRSLDLKLCQQAQKRGIKVVSLRHLVENPSFPTLFPDQAKITRRIVEHFVERGFRNFGYIGVSGNKGWEKMRRKVFVEMLQEHPDTSVVMRPSISDAKLGWEEQAELLAGWVELLPKPIGVMVNHDTQGLLLLEACRRAGARVPDEVAVVSVDNDVILCEIAATPLSSLDQQVDSLGYQAAVYLDRLMKGEVIGSGNYFTEPGDVVARQSSDVIAVDDVNLVKAIRFVREYACQGIGVGDVAAAAGLSRRALEKKFSERYGRSPLAEIHASRLRRVKQLLVETDHNLPEIAEVAGFQYQEYLVKFFRKHTGMTPGAYRRSMRSA